MTDLMFYHLICNRRVVFEARAFNQYQKKNIYIVGENLLAEMAETQTVFVGPQLIQNTSSRIKTKSSMG